MVIHGSGGTLRIGALVAAVIGPWRLERQTAAPVFTASVALREVDTFRLGQPAMDVWLTIGSRTWVWSQAAVGERADARLMLTCEGTPTIH